MIKQKTFFALLCATLLSANAFAAFDENGFSSSEEEPYQQPTIIGGVYQISNAGNLCWFARYVNDKNNATKK